MQITQLDIRDFGVFQGEMLENLEGRIIVVGGANRSGKTSLMQILRNIPYGFSQNNNLPPAKFQYDVRCDLELEKGNEVNVLLKGFSNPEIVYKNCKDNMVNKNLYTIDKTTYRELFTISLDELNKSSDKEDSNLQSMLLGAGFKHIIKIPSVAKELRDKANMIGGTRGNPSTKMFKPYTENIKKGVEGRKKSILLLDTFVQKKNIASKLLGVISSKEKQLQNSNGNMTILDMLKHNYQLNESKIKLENDLLSYTFSIEDIKEYNIEKAKALKAQYIKDLEQYNNDNNEFEREIYDDASIKELLLENKIPINNFYNGLSGIKERSRNLLIIKNEYYEKMQTLMDKIKKANINWNSFDLVQEINCDEVQGAILNGHIEKFRKIVVERVECNKKIEDFKIQKEILEKQIGPYNPEAYTKKYFYLTLFFMILGLILFFIDKLLGCSIIIIGAIGTALYLFVNHSNSKLILKRNEETKYGIDKIEVGFSKTYGELKILDEEHIEMNNIMDEYRDILKLDVRVSEGDIKECFKTAAFLKDEISGYNLLEKKLNSEFVALSETVNRIIVVINKFTNFNTKSFNGLDFKGINIDNIGNICSTILLKVEELHKHSILVEKTEKSFLKLNILQQEIYYFLEESQSKGNSPQENHYENVIISLENYICKGDKYIKYTNLQKDLKIIKDKLLQGVKSQRIKNILYNDKIEFVEDKNLKIENEDEKLLKILEDLYKEHPGMDELHYDYELLNTEIKSLVEDIETLKNKKQTIKDELRALNSDEKILEYDKSIKEARTQLRPLAERYAVYNTAALFLEKIRERFLVNTKDKLLKDASEILSEITSGEYKDIMPMENIMQGDFKTMLQDESIVESSKQLSRGTKEQLFLAVRISRIKEIMPSLPVILDDSFVNFDIAHTKNTVKALVKLAKTHQIFVLTCHSTLVELIREQCAQVQYFKLEKGKFTKSKGEELSEYLKTL
ncbi:AAA family ATPase [Clostridium bowmanii]|uniref:AAA family ATPase n=1 Tax=Clostridium bowmanii TaxID=132925 RepID=UPI001C0B7425|nr:AAA family ATPase [Clostridium bowmanii]MBU3189466.1 AAA family ATPase [Clostridium bowmanii]MCA1074081.1 AAA family ATPase [Clostridium bowmanii]